MPADRSQRTWHDSGTVFFLIAAFAITWGTALLRSAGWPDRVDEFLLRVVKFGPSIAGVLAAGIFLGWRGMADLARRLSPLRAAPSWVLFALLFPVATGLVAVGARVVLVGPIQVAAGLGLGGALAAFAGELALRTLAGGGLGEELGWRGFMLPRVQARVGPLQASLWIGLFHGLWHLPAQGVVVVVLTVYTVAAALLFTWMANRTRGSLFLAALLHGAGNATLFSLEAIFPALDNDLVFNLAFLGVWILVGAALLGVGGERALGYHRRTV